MFSTLNRLSFPFVLQGSASPTLLGRARAPGGSGVLARRRFSPRPVSRCPAGPSGRGRPRPYHTPGPGEMKNGSPLFRFADKILVHEPVKRPGVRVGHRRERILLSFFFVRRLYVTPGLRRYDGARRSGIIPRRAVRVFRRRQFPGSPVLKIQISEGQNSYTSSRVHFYHTQARRSVLTSMSTPPCIRTFLWVIRRNEPGIRFLPAVRA